MDKEELGRHAKALGVHESLFPGILRDSIRIWGGGEHIRLQVYPESEGKQAFEYKHRLYTFVYDTFI